MMADLQAVLDRIKAAQERRNAVTEAAKNAVASAPAPAPPAEPGR